MNTELKPRKTVVQRRRTKPTESAHPEEVTLLSVPALLFMLMGLTLLCALCVRFVSNGRIEDMGS